MLKTLFIFSQHLVPQRLLTQLLGKLAETKIPFIKNFLIHHFVKTYRVNLEEAAIDNIRSFVNFNDFFCRALKPEARNIDLNPNHIISPADGAVSQIGNIENGKIFQAKGQNFTCAELLGYSETEGASSHTALYTNGKFATIYLSPKDYHRLHMPVDAKLINTTFVPGKLFSVNQTTAENVPGLFARNERLVCHFESANGPFVMVLVGAMIVASIQTVWSKGQAIKSKTILEENFAGDLALNLKQGEEMGRFKLGSTVILLFPENGMHWQSELTQGVDLQMGERIGFWKEP